MTEPLDLVIDFDRLHPGDGPAREAGRLLVGGGRVVDVVGRDATVPDGVRVVAGRTVVPGLINAHVHLESDAGPDAVAAVAGTSVPRRAVAAAARAEASLRAGVTAVRDLGSSERIAVEVGRAIADGVVSGPTVVAAGRAICMTGGHGWFIGRQANGPWDVRTAVREQLADGAGCIKFIATGGVLTPGAIPGRDQLTAEELTAGVDEAHRHGLRAAAHAIGTTGIHNAVRAGIDSIEHGHLIDATGIGLMLEHGTALVPTLAALWNIVEAGEEGGMPASVLGKARAIAETARDNLQAAVDAGVRVVAGSDAGTPYNPHHRFDHELDLLQSLLGFGPEAALRAATADAADLLGLESGRLRPGAPADLLVLDHDLADPGALRDPRVVVKAGVVVGTSR
ncbi:imidazolonepropionase-like amidohydrolase [Friedmanniella endophytica]|uniref:Imidazolonepropionase-like amidohydrolase n=1 Tax=Microlunatus kandeliicorticis TaxID=1759536 RepID=A0A7W3ITS1_9ACTN|nr:amidohydrolase family protein [Microlunatus kandeliicorticis]MBA8795099.1 imidazolonepropionase-like amidohydrolase [Microlunatus kandeliicorticis]